MGFSRIIKLARAGALNIPLKQICVKSAVEPQNYFCMPCRTLKFCFLDEKKYINFVFPIAMVCAQNNQSHALFTCIYRERPWPVFNSGLKDLILIFNFVFCKLFLTKAETLNTTLAAAWSCLVVLFHEWFLRNKEK